MAAEIERDRPGVNVSLIRGSRGVFDVYVGDTQIFSKRDRGRFPGDGEIVGLLDALPRGAPVQGAGDRGAVGR